jgi:hypothetical protein
MKNQEDQPPVFKTFDTGENLGSEIENDYLIGDPVSWESGNSNFEIHCRGLHYQSYSKGFSKVRMTSFNGKKATLWTVVPTINLKHRDDSDTDPI